MLIFPGDWHVLKNFQLVLMKVYYHTGLKELAKASGFRAETLISLGKCSCFKRTHNFFLQVWEALYRALLQSYFSNRENSSKLTEELLTHTINLESNPTVLLSRITALLNNDGLPSDFHEYAKKMSSQDNTWKFWVQFILEDCFACIGLYMAIRCKNWKLSTRSTKYIEAGSRSGLHGGHARAQAYPIPRQRAFQ